jgi:ATPase subunit of ABC transporter with duplicated ATPase domains
MSAIHFRNASFSYSSAVSVFRDVSCSLGDGWTGMVGPNGAGKSTLLRLIDGGLSPDRGEVDIDPTDGLIVHCPQTADAIDTSVARFAEAWDGAAQALHGRLALCREDLKRWPTLSPGERKRWQVGAALHQQPDILLLDEPTNHLDTDARELLLAALDRYRGAGVIVSHDRTVLNRLCRRILRVDVEGVGLWQGNYDTARAAWESDVEAELDSYQRIKAEQRKVERRLADKRRSSATKAAQHKRQLRTAGPKDSDARSMEKKGRFEGGQSQGSHEIRLLRDEAERLGANVAEYDITRRLGGDLFFDYEPVRRRRLLSYRGPLQIGAVTLVPEVDVVLERTDRVLLSGPNGEGKSTLLAALMKASNLDPARMLHLPQELTEQQTRDLVSDMRALDGVTKGRVLGIVGVLGSDPKRILATDLPSPGEARKLLIASGLGRGAWVLLLDEPTNHLDLPSVERLEAALTAYPGAMIVVTHDEAFARETTQQHWTLAERKLLVE